MEKYFSNQAPLHSHRKGITRTYSQTQVTFPDQAALASIFYEQAARHGKQIAISLKNEELTYDELNRRSNQLASLLCQIGIQPGHIVMMLMERSLEAYIVIAGILKAGAAYLPVDPATPPERVHAIFAQSDAQAVLTKSRFLSQLEAQGAKYLVTLDELKPFQKAKRRSGRVFEKEDLARAPDADLPLRSSATDLAYVIYTSGSTGVPKGVMIEQGSVLNLVSWAQETFGLTHRSRLTQNYSLAFDASVQEIFSAWASGATLYPIPESIQVSPSLFVPWLREHAISCWDTIPSLWYQIVHFIASQPDEKSITFPQLEVLVLGGEALHADKIHEWVRHVSHAHRIYNVYGPTEATVTATYYLVSPDDKRSSVPIGQAVDNAEVYLLDENFHPCMPGTEGEIWIGGPGLARGYLNAEELTRSSFRSVDLAGKGERRLYRTGDFARLLPDGNLEFIGRRDEQVKVRGYRIELAEIETALRRCSGVAEAVALVKDEVDSRRIVAYYTPTNEEHSVEELREELKEKLPHYMIPHHFIKLTAIPLTANNKVDRAALLQFAHERNLRQDEVYQEPATKTEKFLAKIWQEVLHLEKIGVHDNFFALGGDSILSIMIRNRCELAGIRLKTVDLFHYSTLKALARYIDEHMRELQLSNAPSSAQETLALALSPEEQKRLPPDVGVVLPLLPSQSAMLAESVRKPHASSLRQRIYQCEGSLDFAAFERAINVLVQRHEALRAIFRTDITSPPVQLILSHASYHLPYTDLSERSRQEQEACIEREAQRERELGIEPDQWPLFRFSVHKRSQTQFTILWTAHQIIADERSTSLCFKELSHVYSALVKQKFRPLPQPEKSFSEYIAHLLNNDCEGGHTFWQRYLANISPVKFPVDLSHKNESDRVEEIMVSLDKESAVRLRERARQHDATEHMICLAAYVLLLQHICQQDDLLIGLNASAFSREAEEAMSVVGNLLNPIPLRVSAYGATSISEIVDRVKKSLLEVQPYASPGLANIPPLVCRDIASSPVQTLFLRERDPGAADPEEEKSAPAFKITALMKHERHGFPLTVVRYTNNENSLAWKFAYMANLFRRETIESWISYYLNICEKFE
ncbi:MAG TPA: amino acid adenylation domain-containing protein [Ktedonobacteraceae bacterium]|nr:amino acid adenylation domain-containing protein [Ktedonobacteraceae bacterium]